MMLKECSDVLGVNKLLLGKDFEFTVDKGCAICNPIDDIQFQFEYKFILCEVKNVVLGVLWRRITSCKDALYFRYHIGWEMLVGDVVIIIACGPEFQNSCSNNGKHLSQCLGQV